jgi:hypothetical protein
MDAAEFDRRDFIYSFGRVWKRVMTDPQGFFLAMPLTGGLGNPLGFAALCLFIAWSGFLICGGDLGVSLRFVLWGVVRLFVGAALLLLVARRLFEGKGGFETTFRATTYATAPVVLLWVPIVKYFAVLYSLYLLIIGLQRTQEFDGVKAVLTVLVAGIVGIFLSLPFGGPGRAWPFLRFSPLR